MDREVLKTLQDSKELQKLLSSEEVLANIADAVRKAAITTGTYTFSPDSRSIFVAENLDPVIKLLVPTATPIRSLLPRKRGSGQAAAWKQLTSKLDPSATGTGKSIFFEDAGTPNETTQTYTVKSAAYKLLGRKVEVGLLHVAASKSLTPVEDEQVRIKTLETMLGEEWAIVNADSSVDTNAFDGLLKQITTNSGTAANLTASGVASFAKTIFDAGGNPTHLLLSAKQNQELSLEAQDSGSIQRIIVSDQGGAIANLRVTELVDPATGNIIKLVVSRYMGSWAILLSLKSPAGENYIEMEDLIPLVKLDIPTTTFSKTSFIVEATTLKVIAEPFQYKVGGLAV